MLLKYKNNLDAITPEDAVAYLMDGNTRFVNGISMNKDLLNKIEQTGKEQKPFAAILSCMDSRAPVELLFDQGIGDVFSVRMAGNIASENVIGSLEYAVAVAGSKLIMIMGHTNCGAIKGAVDKVVLGNLTPLLNKIQPAVEQAGTEFKTDCNSSNKEFVDQVASLNVQNTINEIMAQSSIIKSLVEDGKLKVQGAIYCVEKGTVSLID